jgi:hypothetical protein
MRFVEKIVRFLLVLSLMVLPMPIAFDEAQAQERVQRKSILQLLFGTRKREEPVKRATKPRQRKQTRARSTATRKAVAAAPAAVEKIEDARKVLVIGDFVGGGIGEGLTEAFEQTPGIVIETRTNGSSGLVRDDYYNWPAELPAIIAEVKPAAIVIGIGANDRQAMRIAGNSEEFRSEAWTREYQSRIARIATLAKSARVPFFWVGMPAFQSSSMTADMITLNNMYRVGSEAIGGDFIDIWDGFVDEGGRFIVTGSDINGQQVRLRGSDGINLTKAGKRKMAFYVEKEIRRVLGSAALGGIKQGSDDLTDFLVSAPADDTEIIKTLPISLVDPALDGGSYLLGGGESRQTSGKSPRDLLVEKGEVADAPAGRIDDFRLDKSKPVQKVEAETETTTTLPADQREAVE